MKKIALVLSLLSVMFMTGCSKVPAGHVGVKVYLLGGDKGVDSEELGVGRYWIGFNEDLYLFPTFTQNYTWTKDPAEGSPNDESISFQTVEGMNVSADIGISYHIAPDKVSTIFQKYRKGVGEITDIYLRNMVRDALVTAASTRPIETVYGVGKSDLIAEVQENVHGQVKDIGINIEKIYWVGQLRLPNSVTNAINAKNEATQKAQQRQNEVAEAKAAADKKIEEARGEAESIRLVSIEKAADIKRMGAALRNNKDLVSLTAAEKWNGVMPTMMTGDAPMPFFQVDKK